MICFPERAAAVCIYTGKAGAGGLLPPRLPVPLAGLLSARNPLSSGKLLHTGKKSLPFGP